MVGGITFGQYVPGNSPVHRLDPRSKIICVVAAATAVLLSAGWQAFALSIGFTLFAVCLTGVSPGVLFAGLRSFRVLLAVTVVIQVFLTPGEAVAALGPLRISLEGLEAGLYIFLRLTFLIVLASLLTLTTSPMNLTAGLENMLSPLGRIGAPVHELALMMTIAMRFVPTLLQEAQIVIKAQQSRGAAFTAGSPAGWAKSMLPLFVPLFSGALRRAEELAVAMEARCYRGGANRTRMKALRFCMIDYAAVAATSAVLAAVILLER
ncbi:MAG TPA: energy-coupling factor transporter transmembrane component T [Bacillota bacterium]|nr:energy-coupling factor transporter transmembrane component T [Bacillota bacterium]